MTKIEVQTRVEVARAELDPICSEIRDLISADRSHAPEVHQKLKIAVAKHDAAALAYRRAIAKYYDFLLSGELPG